MLNTELLLRVRAHILEEPKRFEMADWMQRLSQGDEVREYDVYGTVTLNTNPQRVPLCKTVACLAGWACDLANIKEELNYAAVGRDLLGLTYLEADSLFYLAGWPKDLRDHYLVADTQTRAEIAAERIDRLIEENES